MYEQVKWYDAPNSEEGQAEQRAAHLLQETASIEQRQGQWYALNRWNAMLMTNRDLPGFAWGCDYVADMGPVDLRSENLVESIGEAHMSKAASSPLKPTPVPTGRSYKTERAVRKLDQFQFAAWRQAQSEESAIQAYLDGYVAGLGCVRVCFEDNNLKDESVFFDNIVIDERECANRVKPRTYRIRQVVPVSGIEALYGVKLDKRNKRYHQERDVGDGYEVIVEAWRLPDAKGEGGRHVVACAGHILVDEAWTYDWVPLAFFHWNDPVSGFHPKSGAEQVLPYQIQLNELNDTIEYQQAIGGRLRILAHANSSLDFSQWDNEAGRIMMYAGVKPEPFVWDMTPLRDLYAERERVKAAAFSFSGTSETFAQADLPSQVRADSSAGLREMENMADRRHLRRWMRYQAFRLEIAQLHLKVLATSKSESYSAVYRQDSRKMSAKSIPYAEIKQLTEDQYSWYMDAVPMNMMQPGAQRELIGAWSARGMGDGGEERRMVGVPNIWRIEELEMASYDDILRHLDILEEGGYEAPTEMTNLTYGIKKVQSNLLRLKNYDDVPPEVIEMHYEWIQEALSIQQSAVVLAQQEAAMTPMQPTQGLPGTSAVV